MRCYALLSVGIFVCLFAYAEGDTCASPGLNRPCKTMHGEGTQRCLERMAWEEECTYHVCFAGRGLNTTSGQCEPCLPGTFSPKAAFGACTPCHNAEGRQYVYVGTGGASPDCPYQVVGGRYTKIGTVVGIVILFCLFLVFILNRLRFSKIVAVEASAMIVDKHWRNPSQGILSFGT